MIKTDVNTSSTFDSCTEKISLSLFRDLNNAFHKYLIEKIVEGKTVTLPAKLGFMYIGGTKRKRLFNEEGKSLLPPDWGRTNKLWNKNPEAKKKKIIIRHTNEHTGGVSYRLIWSKRNVPIPNKIYMSFRLTKANKKKINKAIKEGKEYIINKVVS